MKIRLDLAVFSALFCSFLTYGQALDNSPSPQTSDETIALQRANLEKNTNNMGFGPQSPRNIDLLGGSNSVTFSNAPNYTQMNLCNIHFHKNAEHQGGEFTHYAGNGDGHGYESGYQYAGPFTERELSSVSEKVCPSEHGSLLPGDTIEVHYVFSTADITPGPSLGSCLSKATNNPQLRVEAQVYTVVNDNKAEDFSVLTQHKYKDGLHQALNIPSVTGRPVEYLGSTTGPGYNEKGSPYQVTWSVRPQVMKVDIATVGKWCKSNVFAEDHAHGVRNLVKNVKLLSEIPH